MTSDIQPPVSPPPLPPVVGETGEIAHSLPVPPDSQQQPAPAVERVPPDQTIAALRPLFASTEQYIREMWHDPRYMARVMISFMQLLQKAETVQEISEIMIEEVQPTVSL